MRANAPELDASDVEYHRIGERPLRATVHRAPGDGLRPVVLYVHGGLWRHQGSRTRGDLAAVEGLARAGLVVVAIEVRGTPENTHPAPLEDIAHAMRWLRAHAEQVGGDADAVALFGGSSGGHLVLLYALGAPRVGRADPAHPGDAERASVTSVVCRAPISDPLARSEWARRVGRMDLHEGTAAFFRPWESVEDANPQLLLERGEASNLPPLLVLQGTADTNIDLAMQQRFVDSYGSAGGYVEYELFPGAGHLFLGDPGPDVDRAVHMIHAFVVRHGHRR